MLNPTAEEMINFLVSAQFPQLGSIGGQVVKSAQRIKAEELRALLSTLTPEQLKVDRVPFRGVGAWGDTAFPGLSRIDQAATFGSPTKGSSLMGRCFPE